VGGGEEAEVAGSGELQLHGLEVGFGRGFWVGFYLRVDWTDPMRKKCKLLTPWGRIGSTGQFGRSFQVAV
jgi:hypothetical protein